MRVILIANGQYTDSYESQPGDIVIAADGGARHCLQNGIEASVVIGDMDSLSSAEMAALRSAGAQLISFPTRKDHTDLELALEYANDLKPDEILILAGLGGRWDQTFANILLAANYSLTTISMIQGESEIHFLHAGEVFELLGSPGDVVSLLPLGADVKGIQTHGLEYPLNDEELKFGSTRGISNVLISQRATITLKEGLLLCTIDHSKKDEEHE